jgi:hypothetical protein
MALLNYLIPIYSLYTSNMDNNMIDGSTAQERKELGQKNFEMVHEELFFLISERQTRQVIAMTEIITDINPNQLPAIKSVLIGIDAKNKIPAYKTHYAYYCDALGIDPAK